MNRWTDPEINDYDVLGVSRDASADEIRSAFHWLIDEQGYRVGVPLQGQWQRARQIQAAYETLGDPVRRRTYDESLIPGSTPWPRSVNEPTIPEPLPGPGEPEQSRPQPVHLAIGDVAPVHDQPWPPDGSPVQDEDKRPTARTWVSILATTLALGLLVPLVPHLSSQYNKNTQPAGPDSKSQRSAGAQLTTRGGVSGPVGLAPDSDGGGVFPNRQEARVDGAPKSAQSLPTDRTNPAAFESDAVALAGTASTAQVSSSARASGAVMPEAPSTGPPKSQPGSESGQVAAPAPPTTTVAQSTVAVTVAPQPSGSVVRSPARWIGGGPTDADNRRGRYKGTVEVQFTVKPDGAVTGCSTTRAGDNAALAAMTCRLVEERARFDPARDDQGRPVASEGSATYVWSRGRRK